jgi:hypothetical protein
MSRPRTQQREPSAQLVRPEQKTTAYKTLALFTVLLIGLLGYSNLALAAFWPPPEVDSTTDQYTQFDKKYPQPFSKATVILAADGPFRPEDVSDASLSPLPEPKIGPEPIATPTPAPVATEPSAPALTSTSTISAEQEIKYVVIITIDGMRPDGMELADTPVLDRIRAKGVYFPNAQTVNPSFTLPAHVSMLNGVVPQKHGIVEALPCIGCRLTIGPTVFSQAHDVGLTTGMVFGKEKLNYLVLENSVDALFGIDAHDPDVKKEAIAIIEAGLPNVLFIHLPDTDRVGHEYRWMSPNYL